MKPRVKTAVFAWPENRPSVRSAHTLVCYKASNPEPNRIYAQEGIYDAFVAKLTAMALRSRWGVWGAWPKRSNAA